MWRVPFLLNLYTSNEMNSWSCCNGFTTSAIQLFGHTHGATTSLYSCYLSATDAVVFGGDGDGDVDSAEEIDWAAQWAHTTLEECGSSKLAMFVIMARRERDEHSIQQVGSHLLPIRCSWSCFSSLLLLHLIRLCLARFVLEWVEAHKDSIIKIQPILIHLTLTHLSCAKGFTWIDFNSTPVQKAGNQAESIISVRPSVRSSARLCSSVRPSVPLGVSRIVFRLLCPQ